MVRRPIPSCLSAALVALTLLSTPTNAQTASEPREWHLPPAPLGETLNRIASIAGLTISFDPQLIGERQGPGVYGTHTLEQALALALAGSDLEISYTPSGALTLRRSAMQPAPTSVLRKVRVEAQESEESGAGPVRGPAARRTLTGSKTDVELIEIPQSISVVSAAQISAQAAQSIEQAVNYTPGVVVGSNGPSTEHDYVFSRGFTARQFLDGSRLYVSYITGGQLRIEPYGLERVEILRGPSSALYGQIEPGGLLNLASKRPSATPVQELQLSAGSFERYQGSIDVSGSFDDAQQWQFRLVGLARDADHQSDHMSDNRRYIAPSLTWHASEDTTLTLLAQYQHDRGGGRSQPLPPQGTLEFNPNGRVPLDRFLGEPGFDGLERDQYSAGYLFEHRLGERWTLRQNLRYSDADVRENFSFVDYYGQFADDLRTVDRYAWDDRNDIGVLNADTQAEVTFATGAASHTLLTGIDYRRATDRWIFLSAPESTLDVFAPVYGEPIGELTQFFDDELTERQLGLYAQDQIRLDGWIVTLGGRHDRSRATTEYHLFDSRIDQHDDAWTGRAGLTYVFDNGWAPYASVASSFEPVTGSNAAGEPFKPSRGLQYETGIKYAVAGGGFMALSLFDLTQTNVVTADPAPPEEDPFAQVQTGEVRIRGVELEANLPLTDWWQLIASYSRFDSEITRSNNGDQGRDKPFVPDQQAALWNSFSIDGGPLRGLSAGLGVRYRDSLWGLNYDYPIPSHTLLDAMLGYELPGERRIALSINARNLTDRHYITNCSNADGCIYGDRRTVLATLRYRW